MKSRKILVDDLEFGMYVVELDRPWLGTPFAFQGFPLTNEGQLSALRGHCKSGFVDPDRTLTSENLRKFEARDTQKDVRGATKHPTVTSVEQELETAKSTYTACEQVTREVIDAFQRSGDIDTERLQASVSSMTQSIQRNPDAMLLLNMVRQSEADVGFRRAIDTSVLMLTLGRFLQYSTGRMEALGMAGLLMDVGKTQLPRGLLDKPGALSAGEFELVKRHVEQSIELISKVKRIPAEVLETVAQHHERQDGSGYPFGLSGQRISIDGSIAGLVDTFSAMTNARPYAESNSASTALSAIYKLRGQHYHEALVEQFIQCIGVYPVGSVVELNTREVAIVVAQNVVRRLQPRVMIILDEKGKVVVQQRTLDLVKDPKSRSGEPYRIVRTLPKTMLPIDASEFFI